MQIETKREQGDYTNRQNRLQIKKSYEAKKTLYIKKSFNTERRYKNYKHFYT